jgi:hypothetical protein
MRKLNLPTTAMIWLIVGAATASEGGQSILVTPIAFIEDASRAWWSPLGDRIAIMSESGLQLYDVASEKLGESVYDGGISSTRRAVQWLRRSNGIAILTKESCLTRPGDPCPPVYGVSVYSHGVTKVLLRGNEKIAGISVCESTERESIRVTYTNSAAREKILVASGEQWIEEEADKANSESCQSSKMSPAQKAQSDGFDVRTSEVRAESLTGGKLITALKPTWQWAHFILYDRNLESYVDLTEEYSLPFGIELISMDSAGRLFAGVKETQTSHEMGMYDLCILDANDGSLTIIPVPHLNPEPVQISSDGTHLVYAESYKDRTRLVVATISK